MAEELDPVVIEAVRLVMHTLTATIDSTRGARALPNKENIPPNQRTWGAPFPPGPPCALAPPFPFPARPPSRIGTPRYLSPSRPTALPHAHVPRVTLPQSLPPFPCSHAPLLACPFACMPLCSHAPLLACPFARMPFPLPMPARPSASVPFPLPMPGTLVWNAPEWPPSGPTNVLKD
jgi:hypothetical protein